MDTYYYSRRSLYLYSDLEIVSEVSVGIWCQYDVVSMSMRRRRIDVNMTSFSIMYPLGSIILVSLFSNGIETSLKEVNLFRRCLT